MVLCRFCCRPDFAGLGRLQRTARSGLGQPKYSLKEHKWIRRNRPSVLDRGLTSGASPAKLVCGLELGRQWRDLGRSCAPPSAAATRGRLSEEAANVGIEHPVHALAHDRRMQGIERHLFRPVGPT